MTEPTPPTPMNYATPGTDPRQQLKYPAIGIICGAGVSILVMIAHVCLQIIAIINAARPTPGMPLYGAPGYNTGFYAGLYGTVVLDLLGVVLSAVMLFGAISMLQYKRLAFARTAAILAVIPCTGWCCFIIPLPFGIWALVLLNRPEVRGAFAAK